MLAEGMPSPSSKAHLLSRISVELSRRCNLRCIYCYASASRDIRRHGLADEEAKLIVDQAIALGAKKVVVVGGGEPFMTDMMKPGGRFNLVEYVCGRSAYVHVFTNCTLITRDLAHWLAERAVSVIGKLNSLRPRIQDHLVGGCGRSSRIMNGIEALLCTGFAEAQPSRLALATIICRQNYDELPDLWRWMRQRHIVPYVEIPTLQGRAKQNQEDLFFSEHEAPSRYKEVFEELLRIDQAEFGFTWTPHPPHVARSCDLYHTNCYVNAEGGVQPCAGVDEEYGHLRVGRRQASGQTLRSILGSSRFQECRNVARRVGEPCKSCGLRGQCYGCRGNAWHLTGDIFAGDATCWRSRLGDGNSRAAADVLPSEDGGGLVRMSS